MHNLDRTQFETWEDEMYPSESFAYQGEQNNQMGGSWYGGRQGGNEAEWYGEEEGDGEWYGEEETGFSDEGEWYGEDEAQFSGEGEWYGEEEGDGEWYGEEEGDGYEVAYGELDGYGEVDENELNPEMPFSEADEMALAAELLAVQSEQEFDQFLNKIIGMATRGRRQRGSGGAFGKLGGLLKNFARKTLPIAGTALGNMFVPGIGGMVGGQLASGAGSLFGLETEGMSPEDEQYEVARRYVRFAGTASQEVAAVPPSAPAEPAAQQALMRAAQSHAPGMLAEPRPSQSPYARPAPGQFPRSPRPSARGRWTRRGNVIILHGLFRRGGRR